SAGVQAVDIRHWTFGCAMTFGAPTMVAVAEAASAPPAFAMNLRRSVITLPPSHRHELMVGALGHVVPRTHQRLELPEGGVHLAGHGTLLRLLLEDLGGELLELAQDRYRELEDLYLPLVLCLELLQRDCVLCVEAGEAINLQRCGGVVQHPPQIHRKRVVR